MRRLAITLFRASRPTQLLLVTLVYALGIVIALAKDIPYDITAVLWGFVAMIPISASIHYINEYADYETDGLTKRTPFSGGSGALHQAGLPRELSLQAAWASLIAGCVIALVGYALQQLSLIAVFVLFIGAFFGWMYSVRPLALAWRGWGEVDNAALGAVLLPIFGYVILAGRIDFPVVLAVLPFGMMAFINLLATTWPDRSADASVGKFTLATRWSVHSLRFVYLGVATIMYFAIFLLAGRVLPPLVAWSFVIVLPFVIWGAAAYTRQHSPFPTVAAMVIMLVTQIAAWGLTAYS